MALLQNGYRDFSAGVRLVGLTVSNSAYPYVVQGNRYKTGTSRNLTAGEGIDSDLAGVPNGYRTQYAWIHPQKPGALTSRREIESVGTLTASGAMGVNGVAFLEGEALVSAVGQLVVSAVANIAGASSVSGNVVAALGLAASLSSTGNFTGAIQAIAWAVADLAGESTTDFIPSATGELTATISNEGETLTTANVAAAILDAVNSIEDGVTLRQATRLILAAAAGKISGAGTSTVTIRNAVADDTNRITATVDEDGNRTSITTDLD